jgi:hypothetical protein
VSASRVLILLASVVVSVLGVAAAREVSTGATALAAADADASKGEWPEAIAHARAAAEAVAPGSPWPDRGFRRLESIGHDATARGDESTARLAYAAMRTAALQARSLWSDHADWSDRAEEGLSRLASAVSPARDRSPNSGGPGSGQGPAASAP